MTRDTFKAIRVERDRLLKLSDWTQLPDVFMSSEQKQKWVTYRQELRDLPSKFTSVEEVVFPEFPKTE